MRYFLFLISILIILSCARQGSPSGGPKDKTPPKFLKANPDTLSLLVNPNLKEIRLDFDEYVILKDHTQQIVISPPVGSSAIFLPVGTAAKSVRIKLNEPLLENTTYNINFGQAIQDNNEGNKLSYFQYVFSTGNYIDSLEITGNAKVLNTKKQPENTIVGLFKIDSSYNDSIVFRQKPFYVSRLDSAGNFKLNYLRPGKYQAIAFVDEVQNMQFDLGKEKFGFIEKPIDLSENEIKEIQLFDQIPSYKVGKADQKGYGHLVFRFSGQPEKVDIQPLDFDFSTSKIDYVPKSDSLNFWFNPSIDSIKENSKRIKFIVKNKDVSDTISLVYSNSQKHTLGLNKFNSRDYTPSNKVKYISTYPIEKLDSSFISVKSDSVLVGFKLIPDSKNKNAFSIDFPIQLNSQYTVELNPGVVTDFFGKTNDTIKLAIKTKTRNDYGNLKLTLEEKPDKPFWIQLLNEKDEILEEEYTEESYFEYNFLSAGKYYFKILVDENENGYWDTGDFFEKRQPETSFIFPGFVNVRVLWDIEETWVVNPQPSLKPAENDLIEKQPTLNDNKNSSKNESNEEESP